MQTVQALDKHTKNMPDLPERSDGEGEGEIESGRERKRSLSVSTTFSHQALSKLTPLIFQVKTSQ